jgi:hypothetical protein
VSLRISSAPGRELCPQSSKRLVWIGFWVPVIRLTSRCLNGLRSLPGLVAVAPGVSQETMRQLGSGCPAGPGEGIGRLDDVQT